MTANLHQSTIQQSRDSARSVVFRPRHKVMVSVFSYSLIFLFILGVGFQVCAILVNANYSQTGAGIWCGILYVATGVMGLLAVRREDKPMTIALLCMAVGSVFTSIALILLALLSLTSTYQGAFPSLCTASNIILTVVGFIGFFISIVLLTIAAITSSSSKRSQSASTEMEVVKQDFKEDFKQDSIDTISLHQESIAPSEVEATISPPAAAESNGSTGSDGIYESLKSQQDSVAESATLDSSTIIAQIMEPIYAIPMKKKSNSSTTLASAGDFDIEVDNRRDSEVNENKVASTKWFHREAVDEPVSSDVDDDQHSRNIELPKEDVVVHAPPN
ncbi:uncharacterized protein LOC124311282 isoform X1 [Daphnia pulicaria]|uniref:uncharacterized protein LOC124311282 isoform X1 n=1 Tax=Daphnia pulicaria TaxID=35523 RepID=UPI001EEB9C5D|nr:uncharacterized protein LOC124311282 isoform X1 [Daphnia pulicaria]XP_046631670.1 uncharacterized protein LOC124311282 isoform X1 [Daphnia pulicaria]